MGPFIIARCKLVKRRDILALGMDGAPRSRVAVLGTGDMVYYYEPDMPDVGPIKRLLNSIIQTSSNAHERTGRIGRRVFLV